MVQAISAERWAAIRAVREGKPPTFSLLAAATDIHPATMREKASLESWKKQGFQSSKVRENWGSHDPVVDVESPDETDDASSDVIEPPLDLNDFVARRLAEMIAQAQANGGQLNKAQIDALWSMIRTAERSGNLTKGEATENGTTDDAELAARLEKLDDRIVELAEAHAERLVSEQRRGGLD